QKWLKSHDSSTRPGPYRAGNVHGLLVSVLVVAGEATVLRTYWMKSNSHAGVPYRQPIVSSPCHQPLKMVGDTVAPGGRSPANRVLLVPSWMPARLSLDRQNRVPSDSGHFGSPERVPPSPAYHVRAA